MWYWTNFGVSQSKLIMGIPLYGMTFALTTSEVGVGAPADGPGELGPETRMYGYLSYYEVSLNLSNSLSNLKPVMRNIDIYYITSFLQVCGLQQEP